MRCLGYAAHDAGSPLVPFQFDRRELRPDDVAIDILYCGVCHTDLHHARNDWGRAMYPIVPGHEIVGRVRAVGPGVTKFKARDMVAVGCLVDSCMACDTCEEGEEQYCRHGSTPTYNGRDRTTRAVTYGGYSQSIVVREAFVLRVPAGLDIARVAPLLCAGITTYSPLKAWNVGPGTRLAVVGLGGLGHMGVKLAVGLGAEVTVITTSETKKADAVALGAHNVLLSTVPEEMARATATFDFVLDTIPVVHDAAPYLKLLDIDGALVVVGAIDMMPTFHSGLLLRGRKRLSGSVIGGIRQTQELLDLCAQESILPECETIRMDNINEAFERMQRSDVKYRFVIDMSTLDEQAAA